MILNNNLSEHEMNILNLLAKGFSNTHIANSVYISKSSLNNHIHHIAQKLAASGREDIIRQALIHGLLHIQDLRKESNE